MWLPFQTAEDRLFWPVRDIPVWEKMEKRRKRRKEEEEEEKEDEEICHTVMDAFLAIW